MLGLRDRKARSQYLRNVTRWNQIVAKLRQADVELGKGEKVPEQKSKLLEITEQTYYQRRQKYGGMRPEMAKQLKALEKENSRLKKMVAE